MYEGVSLGRGPAGSIWVQFLNSSWPHPSERIVSITGNHQKHWDDAEDVKFRWVFNSDEYFTYEALTRPSKDRLDIRPDDLLVFRRAPSGKILERRVISNSLLGVADDPDYFIRPIATANAKLPSFYLTHQEKTYVAIWVGNKLRRLPVPNGEIFSWERFFVDRLGKVWYFTIRHHFLPVGSTKPAAKSSLHGASARESRPN